MNHLTHLDRVVVAKRNCKLDEENSSNRPPAILCRIIQAMDRLHHRKRVSKRNVRHQNNSGRWFACLEDTILAFVILVCEILLVIG